MESNARVGPTYVRSILLVLNSSWLYLDGATRAFRADVPLLGGNLYHRTACLSAFRSFGCLIVRALVCNQQVFFGLVLPFADFPGTPAIEASGQQLCQAEFPEEALASFVKSVCAWGNYPGIAGRVLKRNSLPEIQTVLKRLPSGRSRCAPDCPIQLR